MNTINARTMNVSYGSDSLGVFRDDSWDYILPDQTDTGALLIDDFQQSVCSVTYRQGWSGSCMSDNTQQLLPPPENVPENTVVKIQNRIFIDNQGFVDNMQCKTPISFDPQTRTVNFVSEDMVKVAPNSNDDNDHYMYNPAIYNQHYCRQPYRVFNSNQKNLEQQDIDCRKKFKYIHLGLKLNPIDDEQLCDGNQCVFFPDDPVPKDLKNFFRDETLFFSYVNIAPMYTVLFFPKMADVSITNNANQFSIETDSDIYKFESENSEDLVDIFYNITAGKITPETVAAIARVYENSCDNTNTCQLQLNTYTRDELFDVTYTKVIDIVDPIVNIKGNNIKLDVDDCTKINIHNDQTTISDLIFTGTGIGCETKSSIFVRSKNMQKLLLQNIDIQTGAKIFEVEKSQVRTVQLENCTTKNIVKGFLSDNKNIVVEELGCPLKGMDKYCFNQRGCNIKHTNWKDNGKRMHLFKLKPVPSIDGVKLNNYFKPGYKLENGKTMSRFNGKQEVCLVAKNGVLEEYVIQNDKTCTEFYYDEYHDRLQIKENPYFCFRARGYKRIIYGPCQGCDVGILTPRALDPCPDNLYQSKQFNETHCDTARGVRLCDPRCMIGGNYGNLTWTKIGVNYKSSCFKCSCIGSTINGYCQDNEVVNPGYNYDQGIILTEGNGYVGKIGSQLYLDREYTPSIYYQLTLTEVLCTGLSIVFITLFEIFKK